MNSSHYYRCCGSSFIRIERKYITDSVIIAINLDQRRISLFMMFINIDRFVVVIELHELITSVYIYC